MTVRTTSPQTGPTGRPPATGPLRQWVARHPLTAFTVLVFGAGWPVLAVPALTAHAVLAAVLLTAAGAAALRAHRRG